MAVAVGVGVGQADTCEQPAPQDARAQLGDRLDTARLKARLSKSQLAARAALSRTTVTAALNSTGAVPSKETVTVLARALGLNSSSLLTLRESAAGAKPVSGRRAGQSPAPGPGVALTFRPRPGYTPIADHASGVDHLSPAQLQVHAAVLPAPDPGGYPFLTPYLPRPHDARLCESLEPALDGEMSVLVMLTGGSSTGKTRALYEALHTLAPRRRLLRPSTANDLLRLLADAQVDDQVVLWLNEAQRFFYGTSAAEAAASLHQLLHQRTGIVAVGTLWTSPYWEELTRFGTSADPHAQVRELLTDPATARIPVPDDLSTHEQDQWEELATTRGDRRMRDALRAGTADRGRVVQHLSGGPALLAAYDQGPGHTFTTVEHALLTAAIDARRLGHRAPLPAALLAQAADADLDPRERPTNPDWAQAALTALCTGRRPDGERTDIRHTLTALHPHVPRAGAEAGYEPADYLDQHLRHRRADQLGSPALWQALLDHTHDPESLYSLAESAKARGLFQHAARLYHRAILTHHTRAPGHLIRLLSSELDPHRHGAHWIAAHADLTHPTGVAQLLVELHQTEQGLKTALARDPATHADPADPSAIVFLLKVLRHRGQAKAVETLATRAATHTNLANPTGIARLLVELRRAGQKQALKTLLERDPATHSDPSDPEGVTHLLQALREVGQEKAAATLAMRAAVHINLADSDSIVDLLQVLRQWGPKQALETVLERDPATHTDLTSPNGVAHLIQELKETGYKQAAMALATRAAAYVSSTNPNGIYQLLRKLREVATEEPRKIMLEHTPELYINPAYPNGLAHLLRVLDEMGQGQAAITLATQAGLTDPNSVASLLWVLHQAGQEQALKAMLERDPATHTDPTNMASVTHLLQVLRKIGQEKAAATLVTRITTHTDPASRADDAYLLHVLLDAGHEQAAATLATRAANHTDPANDIPVLHVLRRTMDAGRLWDPFPLLLPHGRELDGTPAQPWTWDELNL